MGHGSTEDCVKPMGATMKVTQEKPVMFRSEPPLFWDVTRDEAIGSLMMDKVWMCLFRKHQSRGICHFLLGSPEQNL